MTRLPLLLLLHCLAIRGQAEAKDTVSPGLILGLPEGSVLLPFEETSPKLESLSHLKTRPIATVTVPETVFVTITETTTQEHRDHPTYFTNSSAEPLFGLPKRTSTVKITEVVTDLVTEKIVSTDVVEFREEEDQYSGTWYPTITLVTNISTTSDKPLFGFEPSPEHNQEYLNFYITFSPTTPLVETFSVTSTALYTATYYPLKEDLVIDHPLTTVLGDQILSSINTLVVATSSAEFNPSTTTSYIRSEESVMQTIVFPAEPSSLSVLSSLPTGHTNMISGPTENIANANVALCSFLWAAVLIGVWATIWWC